MTDNYDFVKSASDAIEDAVRHFAEWASENWQMTERETETLTEKSENPREYARGFNAGIQSISDAFQCWMEEFSYGR